MPVPAFTIARNNKCNITTARLAGRAEGVTQDMLVCQHFRPTRRAAKLHIAAGSAGGRMPLDCTPLPLDLTV